MIKAFDPRDYEGKSKKEIATDMSVMIKKALSFLFRNRDALDMSHYTINYLGEIAQSCMKGLYQIEKNEITREAARTEIDKIVGLVKSLEEASKWET
jgi:cell division GTPase FtsZ